MFYLCVCLKVYGTSFEYNVEMGFENGRFLSYSFWEFSVKEDRRRERWKSLAWIVELLELESSVVTR